MILITESGFCDFLCVLAILMASLEWLLSLSHSFTVPTALSLAPTVPLLPGFVQLPYNLSTPLGCLFLIWSDKHYSGGKSPRSAVRVHHVFVLSKSDLGPHFLGFPHIPHGVWVRPIPLPKGSQTQCHYFSLSANHIPLFALEEELR